jgi:hypothetical protein
VSEVDIPFTQYLRPNGRKVGVTIARPVEIATLAQKFIATGGWFECEHLQTGHVSLTACMIVDGEPQDVLCELVENGPDVPPAVDRLVRATRR